MSAVAPALRRAGRRLATAALAAALAAAAAELWLDRHGVEASYFPHAVAPAGRPLVAQTERGVSLDRGRADGLMNGVQVFAARWSGWLLVEPGDPEVFELWAADPARLAVDGRELAAIERRRLPVTRSVRHRLEPGIHRLEVSLAHDGGECCVELTWRHASRDGEARPLPDERLFRRRPGPVRQAARAALGRTGEPAQRLAATLLAIAALALARRAAAGLAFDPRRLPRLRLEGSLVRWSLLGAMVAVAAAAIFSRTGSPFGFDDVRYLDVASFDRRWAWIANRYAHVYLLKAFIWLAQGDAFVGARLFWSLQFGVTVAALAVAARSLDRGWQTATFALSLLLLFSQPLFFLRAGAAVPDFTVGTLVMAAAALYLARLAAERPPPIEWQALVIGLLTVWAVRSKELGVILLWLPALFALERGRLDLHGLLRKGAAWLAGAAAGLASLMALDGWFLSDWLFALRAGSQQAVRDFNFAATPQQGRELEGWLDLVWRGATPIALDDPRMKFLALLVVAAALLAAGRRRSLELRLLHLMPILYLAMLTVVHIRATYVFLARYLYPVIPLSCFLGAAALHYLGIDRLDWRELARARFFVPAALVCFLVCGVLVPYQAGVLPAADFLPGEALARAHWASLDDFVRLVGLPLLVFGLVSALALAWPRREYRVFLTLALLAALFGQSFYRTVWELGARRAWQRGESHLYALRQLGDELEIESGYYILVSPTLMSQYKMFGVPATAERIVKVFLRRDDGKVVDWPMIFPDMDYAFLAREDYAAWLEYWPELAAEAKITPSGEAVLVFPRRTPQRAGPEEP